MRPIVWRAEADADCKFKPRNASGDLKLRLRVFHCILRQQKTSKAPMRIFTATSKTLRQLACLLGGLALAFSCAAQSTGNPEWSTLVKQFEEDYYLANPTFAVSQGRHEFDGRLPDWRRAAIEKEIQRLGEERTKASAFTDAMLTLDQRFERDYLLAQIDRSLFWMRDAETPWRNPGFYADSLDPSVYLSRPYAPLEVRMKAFIAYAKAVPNATTHIRANLKLPLPKTFIKLGVDSFGGYPDFFRKEVPAIFKEVQDPALQAELKAAIEPAALALQELARWLAKQESKGTDQFALGPRKFKAMLQMTERVDTPLVELAQTARADMVRNLASLKTACAAYAPGATMQACTVRAAAQKHKDGPVAGARAQLAGLRQFIIDQDLVSIPGPELALVDEAPPYQRSNSAFINIPGPYDKGMPSVYYIAPPDPTWSKADQAAYILSESDLLFTSVHEIWPGHFLQYLHSNRSPSAFGQAFVGYAFSEGWAHYTEEMMWDAGLGKGDPNLHIGQLINALLRNVRLECAIGLHTQKMTVRTCEKLFRDKAFVDPGNARQQAARGTWDPAYLNYTMGKLMIVKLRKDWTATRGGRSAWKAFHDQFLSFGGPPIPMVRERMMGVKNGDLF